MKYWEYKEPESGRTVVVEEGGIVEENNFHLVFDYPCDDRCSAKPCRHSKNFGSIQLDYGHGTIRDIKTWICPVAVVAFNEGGCCITSVCAMCIIEAVNKEKQKENK